MVAVGEMMQHKQSRKAGLLQHGLASCRIMKPYGRPPSP
jgi:hypothetical protein